MSKFQTGDKVILLDFRHHTIDNSPHSYFWVHGMDKYIGEQLFILKNGIYKDTWEFEDFGWGIMEEWIELAEPKFEIETFSDEDFLL